MFFTPFAIIVKMTCFQGTYHFAFALFLMISDSKIEYI